MIDQLSEWQDTVIVATTDATVEPDKKGKRKLLLPAQVAPAISGLKRSLDNAESTLDTMSKAAIEQKKLSDNLDKQLKTTLADHAIAFKQQADTINKLRSRVSSGNDQVDMGMLIEDDSKAAWQGWTK